MQPADRAQALAKRAHHQFVPGLGYIAHGGPPVLPPTAKGDKPCEPAAGSKDGSRHLLLPPNGGRQMPMLWNAAEKSWSAVRLGRGVRMAFAAAHLSKLGWAYVAPKG